MVRAITAVLAGPHQGRRFICEPGRAVRVGRTDRADFVIPGDRMLSGVHFELDWDGSRCRLSDLGSAEGTLLGGVRVSEARVTNGAWIRAGTTDFSVHFEGATPRRRADVYARSYTPESPELQESRAAAREALFGAAASAPLYGVLDAARDDRIVELLRESVDEHQSLYDGMGGVPLADVAPYLVRFEARSRLLDAVVAEGWGARWGFFLTCRRAFSDVRRQLRRLLMVTNDVTGRRMYFRFYDPRALDVFWRTATPRQRAEVFGDAEHIYLEGRDGAPVRFTRPLQDETDTP